MFWKRRIYLDIAAGVAGNPSSPHEEGRRAKQVLEEARTTIARLLEVQSDDVIFTSGATESNALAILGIATKGDHIFYLPSAHASIVENIKLTEERGVEIEALPIRDGRVDCDVLKRALRSNTKLVTMEAVCGETGVIWNTREVAQALREFRTGIPKKESARAARPIQHSFFDMPVLHVDASQAPLTEKITRAHFGADLLTLDGSKVGAVRGVGALIAHRTIPLEPLYRGGGQERGVRPGSEAPELAKSFATALCAAAKERETFRAAATKIRSFLLREIQKRIPTVLVNEWHSQTPHILNISLPGRDTDYLVALLDEAGFAISTRSACETDSEEGSRAVAVLTGDTERARSTIRISWGSTVRENDGARFVDALETAVAFIDKSGRG